jgi:hypothetical protein
VFILLVLGHEQSDGFLRAELSDSGEILDSQPIQNLGTGKLTCAQTQRALNTFGRHCGFLGQRTSLTVGEGGTKDGRGLLLVIETAGLQLAKHELHA